MGTVDNNTMSDITDNQNFVPTTIAFDEEKMTLLLHIDPAIIDFSAVAKIAEKNGFDKKEEFHITVIGFHHGQDLQKILQRLPSEARGNALQQFRVLVRDADWQFSFLPTRYHITKDYTFRDRMSNQTKNEHRESYIQMVHLPHMTVFYNELNKIFNTRFEPPPPHVTLYTKGNKLGIGINSQEEFLKLNPQQLQ